MSVCYPNDPRNSLQESNNRPFLSVWTLHTPYNENTEHSFPILIALHIIMEPNAVIKTHKNMNGSLWNFTPKAPKEYNYLPIKAIITIQVVNKYPQRRDPNRKKNIILVIYWRRVDGLIDGFTFHYVHTETCRSSSSLLSGVKNARL